MKMENERELIVEYGKKLITSGLTKGTGGNISIYDPELNLMAVSPSGIDYDKTVASDIVVMDLDGNIVEGERTPSVEYIMHSIFYKNRPEIRSVVHTHSVACSTMAALHWSLPASNYLNVLCGKPEVPCAEYGTFATEELARCALNGMGDGYACFLANHGFIAASVNLPMAFNTAEEIEHCSEIYLKAKAVGEPVILDNEELNKLSGMFKSYGQKK